MNKFHPLKAALENLKTAALGGGSCTGPEWHGASGFIDAANRFVREFGEFGPATQLTTAAEYVKRKTASEEYVSARQVAMQNVVMNSRVDYCWRIMKNVD